MPKIENMKPVATPIPKSLLGMKSK